MTAFEVSFAHSYEYSPDCPAAHIHMLPVELLQHIFLLIVNDVPDCPGVFSYGDTTISANVGSPPLVFTRVCHFWRVIAHSTTAIWSCMQVSLPGRVEPLKPFLPSFLQSWLARSGNQPLTLRIVSGQLPVRTTRRCTRQSYHKPSQADSQLLEILLSESKRWGTVVLASADDLNHNFNTPQLRSLQCCWSELSSFNAPNLTHLHIIYRWSLTMRFRHIPTCDNIRHLWVQNASARVIRSTFLMFPLMESIKVDLIISDIGHPHNSTTHSCLNSITFPIPSDPFQQREVLKIFDELCLPMLRKLTFVADPEESEVSCIVAALEIASCNVRVIDFQTTTPLSEIDMDVIEPLFSVAREVTIHGKALCRLVRQ
ncbi:uncharacterized protein EDB93DRAFT_1138288 [Suillus bovinus]|uniref:uncharacterized protein n=1 Tax=Suillus bovinus TaxID=48563 RepID=UPI001B87C2CE|nr:uncharacterized protein EDB93DRAFT_1138288 [Suillus bovinus]KAG2151586.1 hypothetical protein EDB93DRAFT_1138288 [Suillus bovinus]